VALSGELPNVIPEGLAWLLSATLHIPRVVWPHVCALEVANEDLLEILPAINQISIQVVKPSPGRVGKVNGENLHDEEIIIHPTRPTCKVVVFQPNARVGFAIILDDVVRHPEMFWETCITHAAHEHLRPWSLRAEATSLDCGTHCDVGYVHGAQNAPPHPPGESDSVPYGGIVQSVGRQGLLAR
jgi:hypothetical protein